MEKKVKMEKLLLEGNKRRWQVKKGRLKRDEGGKSGKIGALGQINNSS